MSYVTEDDVLPPLDTVGEVLHFHAQFVLAPDTPREERKGRVGAVARMMGLEGVQNTLVGGYISSGVHLRGVSGGQARRLSIGYARRSARLARSPIPDCCVRRGRESLCAPSHGGGGRSWRMARLWEVI